jgi:DNA-binding protein Fis
LVEDLPLNLAAAELAVVNQALMHTRGNISRAAQLLGVERTKVGRILAKSKGCRWQWGDSAAITARYYG